MLKLVDDVRWIISEQCEAHATNFQKKADKLMRRKERKRGKGWTKPKSYKARKKTIRKMKTRQKIM